MSITITSGGFDGIIRSDTDGNIFIETENKSKSLTINGLIAYTGSVVQDLNPATGKVTKERKFSHDTGRELIRSASATANQIEFQQTTAGAFMHLSGSDNTMGINFMGGGTRTRTFRQVVDTFIRGSGVFSIGYNFKDSSGNFEYNITPTVSLATRTAATLLTISSSGDAFVKNNLNVGGTITSQEFHTEVTSASIMFTSGSTKFGNSQDDIHQFTGSLRQSGSTGNHYLLNGNVGIGTTTPTTALQVEGVISASGGISASGNFTIGDVVIADNIIHDGDTDTKIAFGADAITFTAGNIEMLKLIESVANAVVINEGAADVNLRVESSNKTHMLFVDAGNDNVGIGTASPQSTLGVEGDISASGGMSGSEILVKQHIKHIGDTDTLINFTDNRIRFDAGGLNLFGMHKKGSEPHQVTVNNGGNNVDFVINDNNSSPTNTYFRADASTQRVSIGKGNDSPQATLHVSGAGDTSVFVEGHITASGNISSSGANSTFGEVVNLVGEDPRLRLKAIGANHPGIEWHEDSTRKWVLYNDPDESDKLVFKNNSTELVKIKQDGGTEFVGSITASGNISGSNGNILGFNSASFNYITASIIDVDGSTIRMGGEPFTKANIQALKQGRTLKPLRSGRTAPDLFGDDLFLSGSITASGDILNTQFVQMTNSSSVIDTFNTGSSRSAKYVLQVTSASKYQISEMLVLHNDGTALNTEYAQINSGVNLINFSTAVNGSNFRLNASGSFISCSVRYHRTIIPI